jgi:hypothetical protein
MFGAGNYSKFCWFVGTKLRSSRVCFGVGGKEYPNLGTGKGIVGLREQREQREQRELTLS